MKNQKMRNVVIKIISVLSPPSPTITLCESSTFITLMIIILFVKTDSNPILQSNASPN